LAVRAWRIKEECAQRFVWHQTPQRERHMGSMVAYREARKRQTTQTADTVKFMGMRRCQQCFQMAEL